MKNRRGIHAKIDWSAQPLGSASDADIARSLGCSKNAVVQARQKRGILAFDYRTPTRESDLKRFWSKVDKNGPVPAHMPHLGPCWVWTGAAQRAGYGCIGIGSRVGKRTTPQVPAHRFAWTAERGAIPNGMRVLHRCDNPPCVNPAHLFLGTQADNIHDMLAKGRDRYARARRAIAEQQP